MPDQKPTAIFKSLEGRGFRRESGVSMVGSSDMRREFRHLTNFNSVTCFSKLLRVRGSDLSREFRRLEVLAFFGSSDASHHHYNLVTVGAM